MTPPGGQSRPFRCALPVRGRKRADNMSNTTYPGINYGLNTGTNLDKRNGIHYGVISQHSISGDALNDIELLYGEPRCPHCGGEAMAATSDMGSGWEHAKHESDDFACPQCCYVFGESAYPDEPIGMEYSKEGYKINQCGDSDLFVLKSPFFTFAQYCSPCVPGAGNLDSPCADGPKTYCLGHDWFDDNVAPYPVYSVETGLIVEATK